MKPGAIDDMFGWLRSAPVCPVAEGEREWIEARFNWLTNQFGSKRLLSAPLILPTAAYFPTSYDGTEAEIWALMYRVATYMNIDPSNLRLNFYTDTHPPFDGRWNDGTAGLYTETDGHFDIWLELSRLDDPLHVVATLAHELGHVILLGQRRVSADEEDHELLTDLITVFLGLGVITANAVVHEKCWLDGESSGWSIGRQGYMSMDMHGYALALYALSRSETQPKWLSHLRPDVRSAMKKGLRFIVETNQCSYLFPRLEDG